MREDNHCYCPVCGATDPEKIYTVPGEGAIGCDMCLCAYDPWDYFDEARATFLPGPKEEGKDG